MTQDEISTRLGIIIPETVPVTISSAPLIQASVPSSFNWADYCAITSVKDQGSCGDCWVFSTVAAAESFIKIRNGTDLDLSE